MSIQVKRYPIPPDGVGDFPPYALDTPCWGCDRLFDILEFNIGHHGLCHKCWKMMKTKDPEPKISPEEP